MVLKYGNYIVFTVAICLTTIILLALKMSSSPFFAYFLQITRFLKRVSALNKYFC